MSAPYFGDLHERKEKMDFTIFTDDESKWQAAKHLRKNLGKLKFFRDFFYRLGVPGLKFESVLRET